MAAGQWGNRAGATLGDVFFLVDLSFVGALFFVFLNCRLFKISFRFFFLNLSFWLFSLFVVFETIYCNVFCFWFFRTPQGSKVLCVKSEEGSEESGCLCKDRLGIRAHKHL